MNSLSFELFYTRGGSMDLKLMIDRYLDASNSINRSFNSLLKERIHSEITSDQFLTLDFILQHEPCTSTEIAATFGIGKSAVSAQIQRLYSKELIARSRDEKDRRIVYLYVTEQGKQLVDYTEAEVQKQLKYYLSHFQLEEIETFIQSLEKLALLMETK